MFVNITIFTRTENRYHLIEVEDNENIESYLQKFINTEFEKPIVLDISKYYEYNSKTGKFIPSFILCQRDRTVEEMSKN